MQDSKLDEIREQLRELDARTRRVEETCTQVLWLVWVLGGGAVCLLMWGVGWRLLCLGVACVFVIVPLLYAASVRLGVGLPSERVSAEPPTGDEAGPDAN